MQLREMECIHKKNSMKLFQPKIAAPKLSHQDKEKKVLQKIVTAVSEERASSADEIEDNTVNLVGL